MAPKPEMKVKILLIGSESVGTMAAYALETGGLAEVTSVLRSNFSAVEQSGFSIDSVDHGRGICGWRPYQIRNTVPDVGRERLRPFDFVVVTTKDTPDIPPTTCDIIAPAVTAEHSTIVLIQNGLNIERPVLSRFPRNVVLSGVQLIGAMEVARGVITHNEPDNNWIGYFKNENIPDDASEASARQFVKLYGACGKVQCIYDEDVVYTRWKKLLYNSSYNAVAAILKMDVTRMRAYEHIIDDLVGPVMREIQTIALAAANVELTDEDIGFLITVDSPDSWFVPSMGQDSIKVSGS